SRSSAASFFAPVAGVGLPNGFVGAPNGLGRLFAAFSVLTVAAGLTSASAGSSGGLSLVSVFFTPTIAPAAALVPVELAGVAGLPNGPGRLPPAPNGVDGFAAGVAGFSSEALASASSSSSASSEASFAADPRVGLAPNGERLPILLLAVAAL